MLFFNDYIVFVDSNSDIMTFFSDNMRLANVDLNNVSLDDNNFGKILKLLFMLGLWLGVIACSMASNKMVELVHVKR